MSSGPGRDGSSDRKPPVPRPIVSARSASASQSRPPTNTHSLLPSRSASVTRGGGPRMVFRPVRPPPRTVQVKEDPDGPNAGAVNVLSSPSPSNASPGPSRPQAPRPRKQPVQRQPVEMIASGPFSLGSGATRARNAGKSRGMSVDQNLNGTSPSLPGVKNESSSSRSDYREPDKADRREREEYSDQEEDGVVIVDMEDVREMDALAPTALPRMKGKEKKKKKGGDATRVKREISATREEGVDIEDGTIELEEADKDETAKNADALDLSASEDEEIMDDLLDDFVGDGDGVDPENRLYLFQFPPLFPQFKVPAHKRRSVVFSDNASVMFPDNTVGDEGISGESAAAKRKVESEGRSRDVKEELGSVSSSSSSSSRPEGQIGRLDIFRDGRVNFRFNDIVMEVTGGSQSSFLQQVMILDGEEKRATTLGELHRKFVVAPEIDSMLNDVDRDVQSMDVIDVDEAN